MAAKIFKMVIKFYQHFIFQGPPQNNPNLYFWYENNPSGNTGFRTKGLPRPPPRPPPEPPVGHSLDMWPSSLHLKQVIFRFVGQSLEMWPSSWSQFNASGLVNVLFRGHKILRTRRRMYGLIKTDFFPCKARQVQSRCSSSWQKGVVKPCKLRITHDSWANLINASSSYISMAGENVNYNLIVLISEGLTIRLVKLDPPFLTWGRGHKAPMQWSVFSQNVSWIKFHIRVWKFIPGNKFPTQVHNNIYPG
jgi:hypothetical protein